MKQTKQMGLLLLALVLVLTVGTIRAEAAEVFSQGTCGENLTWVLTDDGTLTISGTGAMEDYAFRNSPWYDSSVVKRVVIEEGVTSVGEEAFLKCWALGSVEFPDSLTAIGAYAFKDCDSSLRSVALPANLRTIGDSAFSGCDYLSSITLPEGLVSIGTAAFYDCGRLTGITLPASLTSLGDYAFMYCGSLESIGVSGDNPYFSGSEDGVLFNGDGTELVAAPGALRTYTVPAGVRRIGDTAFAGCMDLTCIVFSDGLTDIGDYAFHHCYGLTDITFPDGLASIGDVAFEFCTNLAAVSFPAGMESIGDYAFQCCDSLTDVTFRGTPPEAISDCAFEDVTVTAHYPADEITWTAEMRRSYGGKTTWVPYGQIVETAAGWTGACRWSLTSDGVLRISGSGSMRNYDYDRNQPWAAYNPWIAAVVIEDGVTGIGSGAFMDMTGLRSVTLPETGLARIGEAAFYGCTGLAQIRIPDSVYTVHDYTFKNCTALADIRLPAELVKIGQGAFENCTALDYIFIPGQTQIIGAWSFKGCTGLAEAEMQWADATEIREGAFKNCTALTEIALPANIRILGESCFYGIGADHFSVPATVTEIGGWCFARSALERIVFRGDAPVMGEGIFNKITLTAWYPADNATWTLSVMRRYGGTVTWQAD